MRFIRRRWDASVARRAEAWTIGVRRTGIVVLSLLSGIASVVSARWGWEGSRRSRRPVLLLTTGLRWGNAWRVVICIVLGRNPVVDSDICWLNVARLTDRSGIETETSQCHVQQRPLLGNPIIGWWTWRSRGGGKRYVLSLGWCGLLCLCLYLGRRSEHGEKVGCMRFGRLRVVLLGRGLSRRSWRCGGRLLIEHGQETRFSWF